MGEKKSKSFNIGRPAPAAATAFSVEVKVEEPTPPAPPSQRLLRSMPSVDPAYAKRLEEKANLVAGRCVATCCLVPLAIILILLLAFPQSPKFGLNSLSFSRFNISASEVTAIWDVGFLARNPNPVWPYFSDHVVLSLLYKNQVLSEEASLPKIHLKTKGRKSYSAKAVAMAKRIEDSQVADALSRDLSEGMVAFTVRLLDIDSDDEIYLNVTCADIKVGFKANHLNSYDGTMLAPNNTNQHQVYARCSSLV